MHFRSTLVSSLLLASAVLAVPLERAQQQVRPRWPDYSKGGAIMTLHDNALQTAQATFVVPSIPNDPNFGGEIWVGIDGATCSSGGLRGGVSFIVGEDNKPSYQAFAQRWPTDPPIQYDYGVAAGDHILVSINVDVSGIEANVTIENLTQRFASLQIYHIPYQNAPCMRDAQWVIQAPSDGGNDITGPLANFTTVTFENPVAYGQAGYFKASDAAFAVNIEENDQFLTFAALFNDSLVINYL